MKKKNLKLINMKKKIFRQQLLIYYCIFHKLVNKHEYEK